MQLLGGAERVACSEHLRAVLGERHVDCTAVLSIDRGTSVGVKTPPQPIVRAPQPLLRTGKPSGELGVATELALELSGKRAAASDTSPVIVRLQFAQPTPPAPPASATVTAAVDRRA